MQEFKKFKGTPYLWVSILAISIVPVMLLFLWAIDAIALTEADLNKFNLVVLASIHCKITFPALSMILIKIDNDLHGIESGFYLPIKKTKIIFQKVKFSFAWMTFIIFLSMVINIAVSGIMFHNFDIINIFKAQWSSYMLVIILGFTMENLSFLGVIITKSYKIPIMTFTISLIFGYIIQLFGDFYFLFSGVPKYIVFRPEDDRGILINIIVMFVITWRVLIYIKSLFERNKKDI